jgi:cob(I)alamin adenosyltransferase
MSICTKRGDGGETDLPGGRRVPKDHPLPECLGTIDELNSFVGDAKAAAGAGRIADILNSIQQDLIRAAGIIAGGKSIADGAGEQRLSALIVELEAQLPPLSAFVIPGQGGVSAKLHIARAVCRRAERRLAALARAGEPDTGLLPYFNRLSDALFLLAQSGETMND